jgi:hypothetical protein
MEVLKGRQRSRRRFCRKTLIAASALVLAAVLAATSIGCGSEQAGATREAGAKGNGFSKAAPGTTKRKHADHKPANAGTRGAGPARNGTAAPAAGGLDQATRASPARASGTCPAVMTRAQCAAAARLVARSRGHGTTLAPGECPPDLTRAQCAAAARLVARSRGHGTTLAPGECPPQMSEAQCAAAARQSRR